MLNSAKGELKPLLDTKCAQTGFTISSLGHAHLDLVWAWPVRETIRKGSRTFATALYQMERYPSYIFGASQAQLVGQGDGGGGAGAECLEAYEREKLLEGLSPVVYRTAEEFFDVIGANGSRYHVWKGPIDLDMHTGTQWRFRTILLSFH